MDIGRVKVRIRALPPQLRRGASGEARRPARVRIFPARLDEHLGKTVSTEMSHIGGSKNLAVQNDGVDREGIQPIIGDAEVQQTARSLSLPVFCGCYKWPQFF